MGVPHPPCSCWRACWPPQRSQQSGWFSPRSSHTPPPSAAGSRTGWTRLWVTHGVTVAVGPPQGPISSPSRSQPTWGDTGTVQVAAQVPQVALHVVDGSAVPLAQGAPAGAVAVTAGIRDLGDICGSSRSHTGAISPYPAMAELCWGVTLVPKPRREDTDLPEWYPGDAQEGGPHHCPVHGGEIPLGARCAGREGRDPVVPRDEGPPLVPMDGGTPSGARPAPVTPPQLTGRVLRAAAAAAAGLSLSGHGESSRCRPGGPGPARPAGI